MRRLVEISVRNPVFVNLLMAIIIIGGVIASMTMTREILPSADLEVGIGDSPDPIPEGGSLTYFLTVTNNGQLDAADVVLEQTLPAEGSFVSASHGGCSEAGGVVTCNR